MDCQGLNVGAAALALSAEDLRRIGAAYVTFERGARSNWHTHPLGQKLVVVCGCGYVQSWGQPLRVIRPSTGLSP